MKKLKLQVENLAVESFATDAPRPRNPGTVHARAGGCTWFTSCLCETAYYNCGTAPETAYSCDYTHDDRCPVWTWDGGCATPPTATCP
jgi:hypothetical protein